MNFSSVIPPDHSDGAFISCRHAPASSRAPGRLAGPLSQAGASSLHGWRSGLFSFLGRVLNPGFRSGPVPGALCARCHRLIRRGRFCDRCSELLADIESDVREEEPW